VGELGPDEEVGLSDLNQLLALGVEITGGLAGATAGLVVAGPAGALGGAALAPSVTRVLRSGAEFFHRHLSHREMVRVGAVIGMAAHYLLQAQAQGRQVRSDGFLDGVDETTGRSPGTEIVEGVLQVAQREYEERKLPYLANLMAEIALRPDVDRPTANLCIRSANELSYRQLELLSFFYRLKYFPLPTGDYRNRQIAGNDPVTPVLTEIFDLATRQYVQMPGKYALGLLDLAPSQVKVIGIGAWLLELMQLGRIPPDDLVPLHRTLFDSLAVPGATLAPVAAIPNT
jgi:hypothetical protein